ncbi:hypothetical protein [Ensifer sp. BR816]|uniref:hypothetical protein n=1 Tax=Rhizobium sp. (strain BR816) TaxID=1057002 RepID=UPI001FD87A78|nr:hypothetical protein [Ensifer sp. BR816]
MTLLKLAGLADNLISLDDSDYHVTYITMIIASGDISMVAANKTAEFSRVGTLTGTPEQVRTGLGRLKAEQVVALTMEHGSESAAKAFAQTVAGLAPLIGAILKRRQDETFNTIIEALVPEVPPPHHRLLEARMVADARKAVLESGDWLTAAEVAKVAGFSASNPSAQPNKWKKEGQVFAVRHRGVDYFPGYALDPSTDFRPVKALGKVLDAFRGKKDDWRLAYWFASVNSFLGGKRPQDLLISEPERVVAAAEDEAAGILHG